MLTAVSDHRSNPNDQVVHAAKVIGRSQRRRRVFEAIYRGKRAVKSVPELSSMTGLAEKAVLEEGKRLANEGLVQQTKAGGRVAYEKDSFYSARKRQILRLADSPATLASIPTKVSPKSTNRTVEVVRLPASAVSVSQVTVDDIDSFSKVRDVPRPRAVSQKTRQSAEKDLKRGFQEILAARSSQNDWGGEKNDIHTSAVRLGGRRISAAFALKGRGTSGKLVPGKMGKNGDQVQRLLSSTVDLFIVQYVGEIDQSVVDQMESMAKARSATTMRKVYYGVIDGTDTERLMTAYPEAFPRAAKRVSPRRRSRSRSVGSTRSSHRTRKRG